MASRGGRGGRFRGPVTVATIAAQELGKERDGPVHDEPELYPMADIIQPAAPITDESQKKILSYGRELSKYWSRSVWNVKSEYTPPEIETWRSRQLKMSGSNHLSHCECKEAMLKFSDASYFPPELMEDKFVPPKVLHKRTQRNLKKLEERERAGENVDKDDAHELFSEGSEVESGFGDEDYNVNHYEEAEDDGDDDGGDDGGIF
eukprot:GDKJ01019244.1.p1 GENE.GDKJ01019244.1~~GDKJ01019244.1.p1  ORF type:complete len:205 (+),score=39.19 GDKJ01019244.1:47-661(+)